MLSWGMGRPKGSVIRPDVRRSRTNLAIMLRESFHEKIFFDWIMMILAGKSPCIVQDARCTETGGFRVEADKNDLMATTPEHRFQAMKMLLDRRDGLPAQMVQLNAELQKSGPEGVINAQALSGLSPAQLGAVVTALRGAIAASSSGEPVGVLGAGGEPELVDGVPEGARQV